jgi:hypothetical protein
MFGGNRRLTPFILLALVGTLGAAAPSLAAAPSGPSVTGGGSTVEDCGKPVGALRDAYVYDAVGHADGSVTGHVVAQQRACLVEIALDVDCLAIDGNVATLSGIVRKTRGPVFDRFAVGRPVITAVQDNGEGHGAAPDLISDLWGYPGANCHVPPPPNVDLTPYYPLTSGNIQVRS